MLKENLIELLSLSFISFVSGLCSFTLIVFLYKTFRERVTTLLVLMIIVLSALDVLISFSAGGYRITLIFLDPLSVETDPKSEIYSFAAFLWGFALRASIIIPFYFCLSLYLEIEFHVGRDGLKVKILYFVLIFFTTLFWAVVPFFFNGYGINEEAMLTIVSPYYLFMAFYLPLLIIIGVIISLVIRSVILIGRQVHSVDKITPFLYFPLVLILCYVISIIRRFLNIFDYDEQWLRYVMNLLMAMQGIFNATYCAFMTQSTKSLCLRVLSCQGAEQFDEINEDDGKKSDSNSNSDDHRNSLIRDQDYEMPHYENEKL